MYVYIYIYIYLCVCVGMYCTLIHTDNNIAIPFSTD